MDARGLVGWNLRRLRIEKGISQEELGLLAGCEPSYIGRLERAGENPTVGLLEDIAGVLKAPMSALFELPASGAKRPAGLRPGRKAKAAASTVKAKAAPRSKPPQKVVATKRGLKPKGKGT